MGVAEENGGTATPPMKNCFQISPRGQRMVTLCLEQTAVASVCLTLLNLNTLGDISANSVFGGNTTTDESAILTGQSNYGILCQQITGEFPYRCVGSDAIIS